MRLASCVAAVLLVLAGVCQARTVAFDATAESAGIDVLRSTGSFVDVSYRLDKIDIDDVDINGEMMQQVSMAGAMLPNDAGAPNLPGISRFIAIPEGATVRLEILSVKTEVLHGLALAPAFVIPKETDDGPPVFQKDALIYSTNAYYPAEPIRVSDPTSLRGVEAVLLGITPFQYNPVTQELLVYTSVDVRVSFDGGTRFGDDRLRSRYWEPTLRENLLNYSALPTVDFGPVNTRDNEYEYVIICPDDPTYKAWADTIKRWRTLQGIDTGVVTLTQTGATTTSIETWINNAYNNWSTPPAAILLLGDYVASGGTTGITSPIWNSYCVSDNIYGDVDGDNLPDIAMARITATPSTIARLVTKGIEYERNPPTSEIFYEKPLMACGWQTERWFTICTEIVYGFLQNVLGKTPTREYAIYSGTPGSSWSSNPNTYMLVNYFGPTGLGYIPATPQHLTDWGGNATRINTDINTGTFMVQHRDHGAENGWGEPAYTTANLSALTNNDLPFVFSINCLTGKYNYSSDCFAEVFHRMEHGALGLIAASEVSYSFVNDAYVFGIYDMLWPQFDPGYPTRGRLPGPSDQRPGFAQAYGKYYLAASSWPYNPGDKTVTYHLFHMHGDAFMTLYSEVPQDLTVSHQGVLPVGATTFNITADAGSMIALTVGDEIVAVAEATGAPQDLIVTPVMAPGEATLTVTKANYYRHSETVLVIYPVTYTIAPSSVPVNESTEVVVTVWDSESQLLPGVVVTVDGWGIDAVADTTDSHGEAHLVVTPPYGENLTVVGRQIGQSYDCLSDVLPVTGARPFASADITAGVPLIGLSGSLTPYYEGEIEGTTSDTNFDLLAVGCGVDAEANSGSGTVAELLVTPTSTGTIHAALAKSGYDLYLEDISVDVVYGTIAGEVYEATRAPIVGAKIKGYPAGADTTGLEPQFEATSGVGGAYTVADAQEVGHYDVYVSKFGYLTLLQDVFIEYGANDEDFYLESAPSGVVSGVVTETGTGAPLEATVKAYRSDNMTLYAETTSDPVTGAYSIELPYFGYEFRVRAYHHIPVARGVDVNDPTEVEDFVLEPTLANILVLSDGVTARDAVETVKVDKSGAVLATLSGPTDNGESAAQISTDLIALGYDVVQETAAATNPATWPTYDFIVSASGDNTSPVASATYRAALESYVAAGGRLLLEGGEVAYDAQSYPGYPTFAANVCHVYDWTHDSSGNLVPYATTHPLMATPNVIGTIAFTYVNYGDEDASLPTADAVTVSVWSSYTTDASVIVYDDNPAPQSGQIVFFQFDYLAAGTGRMDLLENAVVYLTALETPPDGSIAGRACLEGEGDHSGIKVTAMPGGNFAYTAVDGTYVIEGMYDATYTVTATKDGWSTAVETGVVVSGGLPTGGVDFLLYPTQTAEQCISPALGIPDNNPTGVYSTLTMLQDVAISDVEIYLNLTHTYIGDLIVEIRSPEGTTVRLHNRGGGSADNIIGWYDSTLPVAGPGALSNFTGQHSAGEWRLWVSDNASIDVGTVNTWCVKVWGGSPTGVDEGELDAPVKYELVGAQPNPFNPVTSVSYGTPQAGTVRLAVYSVTGREVRVLVDGPVDAGYHEVVWDGRDGSGTPMASGVYFVRMDAPGYSGSVKAVLLK
jgi:subtilisin-like proprotein convertase family protein